MGKITLTLVLLITLTAVAHSQTETNNTGLLFAPLPEILVSNDGTAIQSAGQWEDVRRAEILELFRDHVYGHVPESDLSITHRVKYLDMNALYGAAIQKEVEVQVSNGEKSMNFTILIFLPGEAHGPVPLFLGLNFYGNQTIHPSPSISVTSSWVENKQDFGIEGNRADENTRGVRAHRWPVELILSRGYGLATIHYGDMDPDFDDGFKNGIHGLFHDGESARDKESWGSIGAWAWGLSRAMDYFETDLAIDQQRVAVIGHSRLGKTALWAGAQDERFAMVVSNNSGCGGAALSRRAFGERVSRINQVFPHWFASSFHDYNDNEAALPVDQHMLMALMAPRPLYVASAAEDDWADPVGEYISLYFSGEVYKMYGEKVLEDHQLPEVDQPRWRGKQGYHIRTGEHDLTKYDWEQYLDFADLHMESGKDGAYDNPVSMEWISDHLRAQGPRLILTPELEALVREQLADGDPLTKLGLQLLGKSAEVMLEVEPLEYKKRGRRLLGVSREAIRRLTTLALVYRFEKDDRYLARLEEELNVVCSFNDWNPSHFLDVAEMAAGVGLALDWAGEWLSPDVNKLARTAIIEKALKPGVDSSENNWWIHVHHNWNLVCNGGLAIAAISVFEDEPELSSRILHQAVQSMPLALEPYAPDGIYPEGPSYWFYATTYLTGAISAFESALGTDFGFSSGPGIMESAVFSQVMAGPSGEYYNYFDAGLDGFHSLTHFGLLSWFSLRSGAGLDRSVYDKLLKQELSDPRSIHHTRFFSTFLLHMVQLDRQKDEPFDWPGIWSGGGEEPIVVFRDKENLPESFFLAAKGGRAADNHGNMDAGSFIFELDGVRWSVDPGNQDYNTLEQLMGGGLWETGQDSPRWSLLTKNNFGHSTLTVNDRLHLVHGRAPLVRMDLRSPYPEFTFDMTALFGKDLLKAERTFIRISDHRLIIRDLLPPSITTTHVTWQMVTRAEVTPMEDKVMLQQDGKELYIHLHQGIPHEVKVTGLSPPPLPYDKNIPGLKRIEIRIDRETLLDFGQIVAELTSDPNSSP